jgi:hypothetical protein
MKFVKNCLLERVKSSQQSLEKSFESNLKLLRRRSVTSFSCLFSTECMDWWIHSWDKNRHVGIDKQLEGS